MEVATAPMEVELVGEFGSGILGDCPPQAPSHTSHVFPVKQLEDDMKSNVL